MEKTDTMLCLIGEQPIPNAIPIRQLNGQIKTVEMIFTNRTKEIAKNLEKWLKKEGIKVKNNCISDDKDVNDLRKQSEEIRRILDKYESSHVLVNLTGGTKIMSLAAAANCSIKKCHSIYVDTQNKKFWKVQPSPYEFDLKAEFKVEDIFILHGQHGKFGQKPNDLLKGVSKLIAESKNELMPLVEYLRTSVRQRNLHLDQTSGKKDDFVQACIDADILQNNKNGAGFLWGSNKAFFTHNDWLECLAFNACEEAGFYDVQWKAEVLGTNTDFDVVATKGETLLACSCKAGSFKNSHLDEFDAQTRSVGGNFCKRAIIITEKISHSKLGTQRSIDDARKALEERAKKLQIVVFYSSDFSNLANKLKNIYQ